MKRIATISVILVQLWLLSPVCCCWFKAAANASGGGDCCCSQSEDGPQKQSPVKKSSDCRCSENKVQLPPQTVPVGYLSSQRLALDQVLLVSTQGSLAIVVEPSGPQDFLDWPPPLAVSDRLARLHRLNL